MEIAKTARWIRFERARMAVGTAPRKVGVSRSDRKVLPGMGRHASELHGMTPGRKGWQQKLLAAMKDAAGAMTDHSDRVNARLVHGASDGMPQHCQCWR